MYSLLIINDSTDNNKNYDEYLSTNNNSAANQYIKTISEGSCDTETWNNELCITGINYIWKYIQIEHSYV